MRKLGIIGGSGLYDIKGFEFMEEVSVKTPFGEPSDKYRVYTYKDLEFYFLNRHGRNHSIPPLTRLTTERILQVLKSWV